MRKDRKTVEMAIDLKLQDSLVEIAAKHDLEMVFCPGALLDNVIVYDYDGILKLGKYKPRKYYITVVKHLNEWSSGLQLIMTDSDKIVQEYEELFMNWQYEIECENKNYMKEVELV